MAILTMGTAATTSLGAFLWDKGMSAADASQYARNIKDDNIVAHPIYAGAFSRSGQLFVPNRGFLNLEPGDYVAFDAATGWPILVSKEAAAGAQWVHT